MYLEIRKITDKIIHVKFPSQTDMTETLIRYQEHYESPSSKFRGKIFTLGQVQKWYAKKTGVFSYNHDWGGFNLPSFVLKPFKNRWFDPLTKKEEEFLNVFRDKEGKFYIIGTCNYDDDNEEEYKDHELLHALYYLSRTYKNRVKKALRGVNLTKQITCLKKIGYSDDKDLLLDEIQAYFGSGTDIFDENNVTCPEKAVNEVRKIAKSFLYRLKKKR